jgi:hypothetical protein
MPNSFLFVENQSKVFTYQTLHSYKNKIDPDFFLTEFTQFSNVNCQFDISEPLNVVHIVISEFRIRYRCIRRNLILFRTKLYFVLLLTLHYRTQEIRL